MKICVLTSYSQAWQHTVASYCTHSIKEYCKRNRYEWIFAMPDTPNLHYTNWIKLRHSHKVLFEERRYDVLLVLDADVLITNHGVRVEWFLDNIHGLHIARDINNINAGSMILSAGNDALKGFMETLLKQEPHFDCEQNAIEHWRPQFPGVVRELPHPSINSYLYNEYPNGGVHGGTDPVEVPHEGGQWKPGDFILHLPGLPIARRMALMKEVYEKKTWR